MDPTTNRLLMSAGGGSGELYPFSDITFTPGTKTGRFGPSFSQVNSGASGTSTALIAAGFITVTGGIISWTVPKTGDYRIAAVGAGGGSSIQGVGGQGIRIQGDFALSQGEIIKILVGQRGTDFSGSQNGSSSGGGGGSFVVGTPYNTNASILVIAGGGSGKSYCNNHPPGNGVASTTAENSHRNATFFNAGGSGGSGGGGGSNNQGSNGNPAGYAAAGFFGDGDRHSFEPASGVARAFTSSTNPGAGAAQTTTRLRGGEGGFGGGGAGAGQPGGGGGYSGASLSAGWCWSNTNPHVAGGASKNNGTNQINAGLFSGNGSVTIVLL